jgi:hypothetical protein
MSIKYKCTARRMAGGSGHEHIAHLWWVKLVNGKEELAGDSTREALVDFIEKNGPEIVFCPDRDPKKNGAWVHVQHNGRIKYLQTEADGRKTDNLLSLPEK